MPVLDTQAASIYGRSRHLPVVKTAPMLTATGPEFDGVMLRSVVTRRCPGIGFLSTADAIS